MANPEGYEPQYDFSNYQSANPSRPLPGHELDVELHNVSDALGQTQAALSDVRRADGKLQNNIVTPDSLADELLDMVSEGAVTAASEYATSAAESAAAAEASAASAADAEASAASAASAATDAAAAALFASAYFPDRAALLDDETLWPTGTILNTRTGSTAYKVAAPAATDHHEVTAGGVKLYEMGPVFTTRQRLADAVTRGDIPNGARVTVHGIELVCKTSATGDASALHDLGVNGIVFGDAKVDAYFWTAEIAAVDDKSAAIQAAFDHALAKRLAQGGNGSVTVVLRGRHFVREPLIFGGASVLSLDASGAILMAQAGGSLYDLASVETAGLYLLSIVNAGQTTHHLPYVVCNHACNGIYLSSSFNANYMCQRVLYYRWRGLRIDRDVGKNAGSVLYNLTGDEWGTGEAEFNWEVNYKAIGLYVDTNDIRVVNAHIGFSKVAIWNGAEGFGVEYINCHPYAGNPNDAAILAGTAEKRRHPRVFVNQCAGVVNVYNCYFDGGYVDDQTGSVNFQGAWGVPSEWGSNLADAASVLTQPLLRIRADGDLNGAVNDVSMSVGYYTGNWSITFNQHPGFSNTPTDTAGRGRLNYSATRMTQYVASGSGTISRHVVKQGDNTALIQEVFQPGSGGATTVEYGGNRMRVTRASGGGRIDVNSDQTGLDCTGTDLRFFVADAPRVVVQTNGNMRAAVDNTQNLGNATFRWATVYAGTGTINTSDAREKQDVAEITDEVLDAWGDVQFVTYRWIASVVEKGDLARVHYGLIAQQVRDAFHARGLNAAAFGLLCYDEWEAVPATEDSPAIEAGNRWGIRADQCLFVEAAFQRRLVSRLQDRIVAIERGMAALTNFHGVCW